MSLRLIAATAVAAGVGLLAFASVGVAAPPASTSAPLTIPISFTNANGSFTGTLDVSRFVSQNGTVAAVGTLTGTVTNTLTGTVTTITRDVVLPLLSASGSCSVLHLELGPLDLDLLGLTVHLDKVVLDVSAQSGPGNLLGNLLCGLTNALNSGAATTAVANLLNNLLGLV